MRKEISEPRSRATVRAMCACAPCGVSCALCFRTGAVSVCVCAGACLCVYPSLSVSVHESLCAHVCKCASVYVCMYVCLYVSVWDIAFRGPQRAPCRGARSAARSKMRTNHFALADMLFRCERNKRPHFGTAVASPLDTPRPESQCCGRRPRAAARRWAFISHRQNHSHDRPAQRQH